MKKGPEGIAWQVMFLPVTPGNAKKKKDCIYYDKGYCTLQLFHCYNANQCEFFHALKKVTPSTKMSPVLRQHFEGELYIRMEDITVPVKFLGTHPSTEKIDNLLAYFYENNDLDKPIVVKVKDAKYELVDKYLRYYVADKLGLSHIRAIDYDFYMRNKLSIPGTKVKHKNYGLGIVVGSIPANPQKIDFPKTRFKFETAGEMDLVTDTLIENELITILTQ